MGILFPRILVIGVGLIGGSLVLAGKARGIIGEAVGMGRTEASLNRAKEMGVLDRVARDVQEGLEGVDLVVLATPVGCFEEWGRALARVSGKSPVVTDVGSVKGDLVFRLEETLGDQMPFVGGHPIAGKEKSGVAASTPDLFKGAKCVLTPTHRTSGSALEKVKALWEGVGSSVFVMDPYVHDRLLAAVSHLPHMAAYALVNAVMVTEVSGHDAASFAGGGFRDFTRIAGSDAEMWRDICLQNRKALLEALETYQTHLDAIREAIEQADGETLLKFFEQAKAVKERMSDHGPGENHPV